MEQHCTQSLSSLCYITLNFLLQLLGSLVMQQGKHHMLEHVEPSLRRLALGMDQDLDQDLNPGLRDVAVDLLRTLVMDTGG